jgi:hypothetical protein
VSPLIRGFLVAGIGLLTTASTSAAPPQVHVRPMAKTRLPLGDITVAGGPVLYVAENTGQIWLSGFE